MSVSYLSVCSTWNRKYKKRVGRTVHGPFISFPSNCPLIDLIRDTHQLCKRLRTDRIKTMSLGFSGGKQVKKLPVEEIAVGIVYPRQQEDDKSKYGWKWSLLSIFLCISDRRCPHGKINSNDVTSCQNSICTFCMTMKSSSVFNRINKLDRDYSYHLFALLKYHVTLLLSHRS